MVSSKAETVANYLAELPPDRRAVLSKVRNLVRKNLPSGIEEGMQYGMISYFIPLERYPDTYNGQPFLIAALAAQKNHNAVYLMAVYGHAETAKWFEAAYAKSGKKLDMGKSCVRFKKLEDLPLDVIGEAIRRSQPEKMIAHLEATRAATAKKGVSRKPSARTTRTQGKPKKKTTKKKT